MHSGTSLVELLIFIGILAVVVAMTLPMLFSAAENRLLQQTISVVEHNGTQVLQSVSLKVRNAQRILHPPAGQTGSFLVLQTGSGAMDPIIAGLHSGSIVIVQHMISETISSPQVALTDFVVHNTSTSANRQSVAFSFRVSRTIKLQQPHSYIASYATTVTLLPNDMPGGDVCGCTPPSCFGNDTVGWQVCENFMCLSATTPLQCP